MKILINRTPVSGPWGGGNLLVKALYDYLPEFGFEIVDTLQQLPDAIFIQDPRPDHLGVGINEIIAYKKYKPSTRVLHRVNECDARKNTQGMDEFLRECSKYTDLTIFVSNWIKNYHLSKGWVCKNNEVVYNGVHHEHFKVQEKLNNDKINIVTHHWSSNRMKGFDVYEAIDNWISSRDDFTFTYIGRELGTFKNTKIIKPLHGKELGDELGKYDLYVSGTKFDPGPNHILEALSCRLPTYVYKDGGGAVEFAGESHSFNSLNDLYNTLESKQYVNNALKPYTWKDTVAQIKRCVAGD